MLSKAVLKYINSLQIKKYRSIHQAFIVEGAKSVQELLLSDFETEKVFVTENFYQQNRFLFQKNIPYEIVTEQDLVKAGTYESNNAALAVAKHKKLPPLELAPSDFIVALDDIRDPGNLGTIIRIADWYGISRIVCSETCADFYNPKVIAATMGSFTRVSAYYLNLSQFLEKQRKNGMPVYGAALSGENIHKLELMPKGIVVMGNEAHGIKPEIMQQISQGIKIPQFGKAESLNVATATAIIIDNFMRNA
ncbi:MAG: RNA methyltransferase [Hymenobacteraceae bacterium]|nr:RNA methyltransferase [Hymenobacteraceae bacterium]MDX5395464.1 RNA methyltransferase [Hymenobacteraceae bacterium]MDX5442898.1 RNA methyltransferase [Hymenobacteraceae bacterium]MDX5511513.1 RNA methyltransferase [Hymenobacteraceae bacterium]